MPIFAFNAVCAVSKPRYAGGFATGLCITLAVAGPAAHEWHDQAYLDVARRGRDGKPVLLRSLP